MTQKSKFFPSKFICSQQLLLIRFVNRSKINEFVLNMACGGLFLQKKIKFLLKKFNFVLLHLIFPCYYCSKDLKRQSEHPSLCPVTSSLVSTSEPSSLHFSLFRYW